MLKDNAGQHGIPQGSYRIIIPPATAGRFEGAHQILIGQSVEDALQSFSIT
jgi:hypothetical protein